MHSKKRLIGITGSVASGKSSVLNYIRELGYSVFSADTVVKEMYCDRDIQKRILEIFPEIKIFDKAKIASIIYSDQKKRSDLENFIHPIVRQKLILFKSKITSREMGFAEIPLLFEKGFDTEFEFVIAVSCRDDVRMERARLRGITQETFDRICKIQLTDEERQKRANFIIETDIDQSLWKQNVREIIWRLQV
jgi:dephospho-CoA kinase